MRINSSANLENMITDKTYCPGTGCGIRFNCRRFIPAVSRLSIKSPVWWTDPQYNQACNDCPMYKPIQ